MGNLCCSSNKKKQGKHVDRDLTDDLMTLEKKMKEASGEEELDETQIPSSSTSQGGSRVEKTSLTGLRYESDFLRFLDTADIFKYDKPQITEGSFLKFQYFLDFYKQSMMWNKILFLD
jgi:hypothetical protein